MGPPNAYFFHRGKCYRLRDPILGASGVGGSIWPAFATALNRPLLIINGAVDVASIQQLLRTPLRGLQQEIAAAEAMGLKPAMTIYIQGETNAAQRTSAAQYLGYLRNLRAQLPEPWLVTNNSRCTDVGNWSPLREARVQLSREDDSFVVGPNLDSKGATYRQKDRCHFNRLGQDIVGNSIGEAARSMLPRS